MRAHKYIVNVEAAVYNDGRYLVIVRGESEPHAPGTISFPGGKVEGIPTVDVVIEETLRREVLEEAGVSLHEEMHYVRSNAFVMDDGEPVVNIVFICRYATGELKAVDPVEVAQVCWMTPAEIEAHPRTPPWTKVSLGLAERVRKKNHW